MANPTEYVILALVIVTLLNSFMCCFIDIGEHYVSHDYIHLTSKELEKIRKELATVHNHLHQYRRDTEERISLLSHLHFQRELEHIALEYSA